MKVFTERNEAVALLKEVANACKHTEDAAILIVPQVQNSLVTYFMLHKKTLEESELKCIEKILKNINWHATTGRYNINP